MQILEARVHARQQICLLNSHMLSLHFRKRHHCFNLVRTGYMRNYCRKIKFELDGVFRVWISAEFVSILPPRIDVGVSVARTARETSPFGSIRLGAFDDP